MYRGILFLEYFLRIERWREQTHSCDRNLQETRQRRKEGKWSDMGNYRTRVHLTDNATGWDQWQRGDWPVWSSTVTSFSLSEAGFSPPDQRLAAVYLTPRREARVASEASHAAHHVHHRRGRVGRPQDIRVYKVSFLLNPWSLRHGVQRWTEAP